jgi:hypothetical protein
MCCTTGLAIDPPPVPKLRSISGHIPEHIWRRIAYTLELEPQPGNVQIVNLASSPIAIVRVLEALVLVCSYYI